MLCSHQRNVHGMFMNISWHCHTCAVGTVAMPWTFHEHFMKCSRSKSPYYFVTIAWQCGGNSDYFVAMQWEQQSRGNLVAISWLLRMRQSSDNWKKGKSRVFTLLKYATRAHHNQLRHRIATAFIATSVELSLDCHEIARDCHEIVTRLTKTWVWQSGGNGWQLCGNWQSCDYFVTIVWLFCGKLGGNKA